MDMVTFAATLCALVYPNVWDCKKEMKWTRNNTTIEACHQYAERDFIPRHTINPGFKVKYRCYKSTQAEVAKHWDIVCKNAPNRCRTHDG